MPGGSNQVFPALVASAMRPCAQRIATRRGEIPHFSAACFVVIKFIISLQPKSDLTPKIIFFYLNKSNDQRFCFPKLYSEFIKNDMTLYPAPIYCPAYCTLHKNMLYSPKRGECYAQGVQSKAQTTLSGKNFHRADRRSPQSDCRAAH